MIVWLINDGAALRAAAVRGAGEGHTHLALGPESRMADISDLPIEVTQYLVYESGVLGPTDVLAFALTNKDMYRKVFGVLGEENAFDKDQHRAVGGVAFCMRNKWWNAAVLAIKRGYGDVEEMYGEEVRVYGGRFRPTPFLAACQEGKVKVVKALLQRGVEPTPGGLLLACGDVAQNSCIEIVRLLLKDRRANPALSDDFVFRAAARHRHTEIVRLLLQDDRVNPAANDDQAIGVAAQNGHTEIVRLLLQDDRVNPAANDDQAIGVAAKNGHTEIVRLLLQDGRANPGARDNAFFGAAAKNGHTEIIRLLLQDDRVNPAARDNLFIRLAAQNGHTEIVRLLLEDDRVSPAAQNGAAPPTISDPPCDPPHPSL